MQHQSLHLKQLQKLSPQQIQLVKLLQVPTLEIEQSIQQELEENPALEEEGQETDVSKDLENSDKESDYSKDTEEFDIRDYLDEGDVADYKLRSNNYISEDSRRDTLMISETSSFLDYLLSQFYLLPNSDEELIIGETIIGNIDEKGYLQRELPAIIDDLAFSQNVFTDLTTVKKVLKSIQSLDPAGVGAKNLQECLLLQLRRKYASELLLKASDVHYPPIVAQQILVRLFDSFIHKRYDQILQRLNISESVLSQAIQELTSLNPKPANVYTDIAKESSQPIIPDFTVIPDNDHFEITLNSRNSPELRINKEYSELLQAYSENKQKTRSQKETLMFVRQKIDSARSFIETIKLRQDTLLGTMEAIVNLQADYFQEGDLSALKPMKMQEIADRVGLDVSTISRVVNRKYVQTSFGIILLRDLFSNAISDESGEDVTSAEVKGLIKAIIDGEDKRTPLNDEALTAILAKKGYTLARRTVAKYRERLNIGVARLRKMI